MRHHLVLFISFFALVTNRSFDDTRFFPANSIYTTARMTSPRFIEGMIEEVEFRETIYYNIWTGNDTIVDGRECVTIWNNLEGIVGLEGVVYEDSTGLVYINRLQEENMGWEFLYDFTQRDWKVGDKIRTDFSGLEGWYEKVEEVSSITLHNGESVPCITTETSKLIYGIGYFDTPAFSRTEAYNGFSWRYDFVNFYRNGELLWGEEISQTSKPYLVTEGKQWAVCRHTFKGYWTETYRLQGDTIINGKTYKIEHASRNEDLSDMKPSGRYMREEDGRVYSITDKDQRDDFVFDYSMEVGDTLFYNSYFDYYGNEYEHPICLRLIAIRDTIMPNGDGRVRKCYDTEEGYLNSDDMYEFHPEGKTFLHSFIEDIGYTATGLSPSEIGTTGVGYSLLYVKQGDTMLYQQEDGVLWKDTTSVEGIKTNNHDTPYYDLQGRPIANPTRGIYIKDGKKVTIDN